MSVFRCFLVVLVLLALPTVAMADHHELMQEVKTFGEAVTKAMLAEDVDSMLNMYTDDAISLPNFGPRMDGKEEMKKHHEQMAAMGMKITSFDSEPTEVWQAGDQVIEVGTYHITMTMGDAPAPIEDKGKYVTVYVRDKSGALKIKVETWNTDMNPMAMGDSGHSHE